MCYGALGSDTGGSIRIPAHFCGIVGIKPAYGAVSRHGLIACAPSLDQIGVLAKNEHDGRLLLSAISEYGGKSATSEKLEKIDLTSVPSLKYAAAVYRIISCAEIASSFQRYDGVKYGRRADGAQDLSDIYELTRTQNFGEEVKKRILLGNFFLSSENYEKYYVKAAKIREIIKKEITEILEKHGAILIPTTEYSAPKPSELTGKAAKIDEFCVIASLVGCEAVSCPSGQILTAAEAGK
jgi:aspartyl-tRNA(Asn)/glutamyl-tRNA(Gln) amidotransferase subunit A